MALSACFCWLVWNKWNKCPVVITMTSLTDQHMTHQFPSVTICSTSKVSKRKLQQFMATDRYENISYDLISSTLRRLAQIDTLLGKEDELKEAADILNRNGIYSDELVEILNRTAPSCDDIVIDCIWQGIKGPCANLIRQRLTDFGICCSFSPNESDHSIISAGHQAGLGLILDSNLDDSAATTGSFDGFKIRLHESVDFPEVIEQGFIAGPGLMKVVAVDLMTFKHTNEVAKLDARQRNCYVEGDRELKYFNNYTQSACRIECMIKEMINQCQCLPYFFRQLDLQVPHCEIDSYPCTGRVYGKQPLQYLCAAISIENVCILAVELR